ncbi:MAG: hypothetical protein IJT44_05880 [Clostridia bacterium]|nr:hypothetical protein [Clostridia bacterium]
MDRVKLQHAFLVVVLVAITIVILFAVSIARRGFGDVRQTENDAGNHIRSGENIASGTADIPTLTIRYDEYIPSEIDEQAFDDTVIIGNSQAEELSNYGLVTNADFVARVGLSIHQVLSDGTGSPPISEIYGNHYTKAVLVFGENELGWPYPENFISHYKELIDKVRELNPGVKVYCQAIFPVTTEYSNTSTNGINNENVVKFNEMIREMCEEVDAVYLPVSDAFYNADGALPDEITTDGVHFSYQYCKLWAGDLSAYLAQNEAE